MALFKNILKGIALVPDDRPQCPGRFYRLHDTMYRGSRGEVVIKQEFRPLKRMSCPGCEQCGWADEQLQEFVAEGTLGIEGGIHDGGEYRLTVINEERDWETGDIDNWELAMVYVSDVYESGAEGVGDTDGRDHGLRAHPVLRIHSGVGGHARRGVCDGSGSAVCRTTAQPIGYQLPASNAQGDR